MAVTPIVLCVDGNPWFDGLKHFVKSAREYSPETPIFIVPISSYSTRSREFAKVFRNHSPNPHGFELSCFQRWFALSEFCSTHKIDSVWSFDWDVLLFTDLTKETVDGKITANIGCGFYCSDMTLIDGFCDYMMDQYGNGGIKPLVDLYSAGKIQSVCDYELYSAYFRDKQWVDIGVIKDRAVFDNNLAMPFQGFKVENGCKVLKCEHGFPYGEQDDGSWVRLKTFHCWGEHKTKMEEYLKRCLDSRK